MRPSYFAFFDLETDFVKNAKKSLGQNFLVHEPTLLDIASATEVSGRDVVEVGPGYGALTEHLVAHSPRTLHLVELDRSLAAHLRARTDGEWHDKNIVLSEADVLGWTPPYERYSVIANIPYYITSPILFRFLYELPNPPESMVILMQREVGDRILESDSKSSLLSLALSARCRSIDRIADVPAERFRPAPKVDSVVLRFEVDTDTPPDAGFVDFLKK
jgi:16S rRNA (adenine1518-N6/adenine1519-N6)-dimethyltransferase